jgi:iron complex outermembrane receptor protein/vitamin B12 transporter
VLGALLFVALLAPMAGFAASPATLHGVVSDPLGAVVAGARVELVQDAKRARGVKVLQSTTADAQGNYRFSIVAAGRYAVRAAAPTFQATTSTAVFLRGSEQAELDLTLATATRTDEVTVTATGTPTPEAQLGASVTVLGAEDYRNQTEVQDPLRHVPGVLITQTGQVGGTTGLSIRGGNTNANKVMIDGVPADDIGGAVEFANLATVGVDQIEVLREPNSALYGSDALAGVVSMTTTRGTTPLPLLTYTGDAGSFGSYRNQITGGGVYKGFDYYSAFGRMDTRNNLPNDEFHNGTYVGNFGLALNPANELRFTVHHMMVSAGQPNAILLYGIADDAAAKAQNTYLSASWNNQATSQWHNEIRYGGLRLRSQNDDFAYTGIPDPAGSGNYLGNAMTINGANGYSVAGQAIFQYAGTYPSQYVTATDRDFVYAQTDYHVNKHLTALAGFKYEAERGTTDEIASAYPAPNSTITSISRGNYSYMMQLAGDLGDRLYYTLGSGLEDNGLFGFAATPRASLAYYLARPSSTHLLSGTKLHGSFGKGIKEPSIYYQANSLYGLLAAQPDGSQTIAQDGISPIGPEESRTFDGGVEQEIAGGRGRLGITYFHNQFTNGVEFVPQGALAALGVTGANLAAVQYGAAVNSEAYRAQGLEIETEYKISEHLFARGGYTYTDAVVQRSFATYGEPAVYNTASNFSTVQIGQFSPLVGARPFRVAPHTGYFGLNYTRSKFYGSATGTMVGRRDDSDFLYDANYGSSLLLPNRNLDGAYQRLDVSSGYQVTPMLATYLEAQNVLSEHYAEAFGYPALPLTFRAGLKITFGGESWRTR